MWTPGHCGILGNELADGLSRQASAIKYTGPEPVLGVTSLTVRNELQHWACREQWKQWREATKFRQVLYFSANNQTRAVHIRAYSVLTPNRLNTNLRFQPQPISIQTPIHTPSVSKLAYTYSLYIHYTLL